MKKILQPINILNKLIVIGVVLVFSMSPAGAQNIATNFSTTQINMDNTQNNIGTLSVYPNPAADEAKLVFSSAKYNVPYQVRMIDNSGAVLINIKGSTVQGQNTVTFHVGNYPAGVYYVQLLTVSGRETLKLMKQHLSSF